MSKFSRRKLIAAGVTGAAGFGAAAYVADGYGLIPPRRGGFYALGDTLTYAAHRLLTRHSLAKEFSRSQISKSPFANGRPFDSEEFQILGAGGFADWRVAVDGMVAKPMSLSLEEIRGFPASSQITQLACEEGWSFIAEWVGAPLSHILELAEALPQARYVVYFSMQGRWKGSIDMADALHPQTLLTYGMNGGDLPVGHGGPLRMRVPRQLGYKNVKYVNRLTVTDSLEGFETDGRYSWYAGI
jgi:DMSO/TMAO reductase YedYZ molybdopterin-dependent catalytic subunit